MNPLVIVLIVTAIVVGFGAGWLGLQLIKAKKFAVLKGEAEKQLVEAREKAAAIKKEAEIKSKEEQIRRREEVERDIRTKQKEIRNLEKRVQSRESSLERKSLQLDEKSESLDQRTEGLKTRQGEIEREESQLKEKTTEMQTRLEQVAGLSAAEAKDLLMQSLVDEARKTSSKIVQKIEEKAREEASEKAKRILATAIQRYAGEHVAETTVSSVTIPDDQMKGRIIGREGRNIRAIEAATGCDLIIDDTPEAILISSHNPVRRAIARRAMEKLVHDGRIHPGRIESVVKQAEKEIGIQIKDAGEKAALDAGAHNVNKELLRLLGGLKFRQVETVNVLQHSEEVSALAGLIAAECGLNEKLARRAGLLHDLGKSVDHDIPGPHPQVGAEMLKRYGESREVVEAVLGHHDEIPTNIYSVIVQAADQLANARPGAKRETMGGYIKRLADLEALACQFPGTTRAFAIQAGRELHVVVDHTRVGDEETGQLARDIAARIESDMSYAGQIHITVIRENRAVHYAK